MRTLTLCLLLLPLLAFGAPTLHHYRLKNGLNLYVQVNKRSPVVISQVWYKVGGSYENNGLTGISHLLEHLMFQGTQQHPAGYLTDTIARLGGLYNAMTGSDYTVYFEIVPKAQLKTCFALEADRMQHLKLTQAQFDKELSVVKTEKRMRVDNVPQHKQLVLFNAMAFISNPYHHPTIGWQNDLDNMTLADAKYWYHRFYHPNNADLVVVGDISPEAVYQLAQKTFGPIPAEPIVAPKPRAGETQFSRREQVLHLDAELPNIYIGFNTPAFSRLKDKSKAYALAVLADILAGNTSAILPSALIRRTKQAVAISSYYSPYTLHDSLLIINAVPAQGVKPKALAHQILKKIHQLQTEPLPENQLKYAKIQLLAQKTYALDSLSEQASQIGALAAIGISPKEADVFFEETQKVTPAQVQAVAKEYLIPSRMTVSYLRPKTTRGQHAP